MMQLIEKLKRKRSLDIEEYQRLIDERDEETASVLAAEANKICDEIYGDEVYTRGLIEISNICKNDCYYCGIRRSNRNCVRYRLSRDEILECAAEGYELGFRTFVLQGGEDPFFTDQVLEDIIGQMKSSYPDCAVTLSLG